MPFLLPDAGQGSFGKRTISNRETERKEEMILWYIEKVFPLIAWLCHYIDFHINQPPNKY